MKRVDFRTLVAMVFLAAAAGCEGDPTADLRGGPNSLGLSPNLMFIDEGDTKPFKVTIRDQQLNPVAGTVTVTSTDQTVATVVADTEATSADNATYNFIITALSPGQARLAVNGAGLNDTATVTVLPLSFTGTASTASPIVGQTLTLVGTSLLGFDLDSANVDFGEDELGEVIRVTLDTLIVRVPQPEGAQPSPVTVKGVAVKYVPGLVVSLPSAATFDVQPVGDRETIGDVTITIPDDGAPDLVFYDGFKAGEPIDYFYQYTLSGPDTLTFTLEWTAGEDTDLDMANCTTSCPPFVGGFGAATGANPETYTVIFAAGGTYNLLVEQFDDADVPARLFKVTIRNP